MKRKEQYAYLTGNMGEQYLITRLEQTMKKLKELNDSEKLCEGLFYQNKVQDLYRKCEISKTLESTDIIIEYHIKIEKIMDHFNRISKGKVHILILNTNLNRIDNEIIQYLNNNDILLIGYNKEDNDYDNISFEYCVIEALGYFLQDNLFKKYEMRIMGIVDKHLNDVNLYCTSKKDEEIIAVKLIMYAVTVGTDLEVYLNETHYTSETLRKIRKQFISMLTPTDKYNMLLLMQ